MAYNPENNPYIPGDPASYDIKWIVDRLNEHKFAEESAAEAKASAEAAEASASEASGYAADAEGYKDAASGFADDASDSADAASDSADEAADYAAHIADPVSGLVTSWLNDHITQPTTPPIDTSLSVAGAAADAKAAGDAIRAITPTILKIQDNIYGTNGGIYYSTKVHRNSAVNRRTDQMYYVSAGQKIGAYLAATRDYLVIAFYSAASISAANYVDGVRGKISDQLNYYEFTAPQNGYVVFTTSASVLTGACAFILDEYLNGEQLLDENTTRVKNLAGSSNKVIKELIRPNTTVGSTGAIGTKAGDIISNKIKVSDGDVLSVHAKSIGYLSVNVYNSSGTFLGRAEYTYAIIPTSGDFFACTYIGAGAAYAIICATVLDAYYQMEAYVGAVPETPFDSKIINTYDQLAFTDVAAHRGYTLGYPENTDISTKQARIHNFKAVENDVRFTSDGVAVLLHDPEINRTARNLDGTTIGSTVNIAGITYAQCANYDFGVYAGSQFAGTPIGTLEDQLSLCKRLGMDLWIEPKVTGHAADIINLVKKTGMIDHVSFIGFSAAILSEISALLPKATLMLARSAFSASYLAECISLKTSSNKVYAYIDYSNPVTSSDIDDMIAAGIELGYYTVDNYNSAPLLQDYCTRMCSSYYRSDMIITEETLFTP